MTVSVPRLRVISGSSEPGPADLELVRAFLTGDVQAFGALTRRHQSVVFRAVRRYAASPEDARDLVQRTFLQAFEAAERSFPSLVSAEEGAVPVRAWLIRIAVNLSKNFVRDAGRWPKVPAEALERQPAEGTAERSYVEAEERAMVRDAVLELPPRQREVFTLRIDAGLPFAEIAAALGITEGNAKAHFHHAVNRLKTLVHARAGEESSS